EAWERKRNLAQAISNQRINELYELGLKHGALGGKLLGAGNGGYLLFFYPPQRRNELKKVLERNGGAVLDFNFDFNGTVIWPVKPRL
ncbi:MAG TPA: GHMP kinase, partial [Candidatus Nanoarchaeia archaeon]|nr:GHMP kinase [Candidatus Nanoarchaeia archaeon]